MKHTIQQIEIIKAFVAGAKWWEYKKTGGTMWQSDQNLAIKSANKYIKTRESDESEEERIGINNFDSDEFYK